MVGWAVRVLACNWAPLQHLPSRDVPQTRMECLTLAH